MTIKRNLIRLAIGAGLVISPLFSGVANAEIWEKQIDLPEIPEETDAPALLLAITAKKAKVFIYYSELPPCSEWKDRACKRLADDFFNAHNFGWDVISMEEKRILAEENRTLNIQRNAYEQGPFILNESHQDESIEDFISFLNTRLQEEMIPVRVDSFTYELLQPKT